MCAHRESKRQPGVASDAHKEGVAPAPLSVQIAMDRPSPGLWLVATPIGNMGDITLRALSVLAGAEVLAAEDTRRLRGLLDRHGIAVSGRRMLSYHDRNGAERRPQIMAMLDAGQSVAYVSDAGTPLIADPGYRLVTEARTAGIPVHTAPGVSAVIAALSLAGLPTDRFLFAGFLPPKSGARRRLAEELAAVRSTLVFFETGPRLAGCLQDLAEIFGEARPATIARELTKTYEDIRTGRLGALAADYAGAPPPKGEIVLIVGPPLAKDRSAEDNAALETALTAALRTMSVKTAAAEIAEVFGVSRRVVYAEAVRLAAKTAQDG